MITLPMCWNQCEQTMGGTLQDTYDLRIIGKDAKQDLPNIAAGLIGFRESPANRSGE